METRRELPRTISIFTLTMINIATIGSVKNWPLTAEYGFSSLFFFLFSALIFFIPTALVSAELATGWPKTGGVFVWVKEAFGHRTGFLAIWLQWVQNIIWYPTALSFIAGTIAYIIDPKLANNKMFTAILILVLFWSTTYANLRGMRTSGLISSLGMIFGTFLPGIFIIILGLVWYFKGNPMQISFTADSFFPNMSSPEQLVFFTGVLISLAGMEMSAVHARDVKHPQKDYPKAILLSFLIILGLSIPGVLAIAAVIPQSEINLLAGSLQAISYFVDAYGLGWVTPYMAALIAIGAIGSVSTWAAGPSKGLLAAAETGDLPPLFRKINKEGMPISLLVFQAIVVSLLAFLFVFMPTLNSAYWMLTVIVGQVYLVMYVLMFAAAIKLRYKKPKVDRPYKIPGGKMGMWITAGVGILTAIFAMVIGFFPPSQIAVGNVFLYVGFLIFGVVIFCLGPYIILLFRKPEWLHPLAHEKKNK